ncbi:MAG: hypothetical protein Q7U03_00110 [Syntrophales bacterium]|nr:hypothetical protein [Syntrophales bacterium]
MATYAPNQLHSVPLAELQPDPAQPRKYLDPLALEELTASEVKFWRENDRMLRYSLNEIV